MRAFVASFSLAFALTGCCSAPIDAGRDAQAMLDKEFTAPLSPPRAFRDDALDGGTIRRLLVLPLADESEIGAPTDVVNAMLRDELIRLRRFDVVQPIASDATSKPGFGPKKTGRVEVATIIELGRRYGVDAVLFGAIDRYRPYAPQALGITSSLIDVQTGKIIWEVRDFLDAADRDTEAAMQAFYRREASLDETVMGSEIVSASPSWFARFASRRLTRTLEH